MSPSSRAEVSGGKVNWIRACEKGTRAAVNSHLIGAVEKKLEKMGDCNHEYGMERFGGCESSNRLTLEVVKSRR